MNIQRVAVFCGSQSGKNPIYQTHAIALAEIIAKRNLTLIYGGGNSGLMGAVANTAMQHGGKVIGVIPELFMDKGHHHEGITELHIVKDMHIRKKMMYDLSDMATILPGGFGTMDELFEMITWNSLKIHEKKLAILNSANYYGKLFSFMDDMEEEQFLYDSWRKKIHLHTSPSSIFI